MSKRMVQTHRQCDFTFSPGGARCTMGASWRVNDVEELEACDFHLVQLLVSVMQATQSYETTVARLVELSPLDE